jgi:hypothetical protein
MAGTRKDRLGGVSTSVAVKAPVVTVSTANLTLSGHQTVNSIALVSGDRVLVKDQTAAIENGIYNVDTSAWQRAVDFDGNRDVVEGTLIIVVEDGGLYTLYRVNSSDPMTIGVTPITFVLYGGITDTDAIHDNVSGEITAISGKPSPVAADVLLGEDSESGDSKIKIEIGNLPDSDAGPKVLTLPKPTNSEDLTLLFFNKAVTLTQIRAVLPNGTGSPSITYQIKHHTDRSNAGNNGTASTVVTSTTTGTNATLSDATIPADSWVWVVTTAKGGTVPSFVIVLFYDED